jgi:hypothetical protein
MLALAAMFIASLAASIWLSQVSPSAGFYLLPSRVWELAAGAIVGVFLQKNRLKQNAKSNWLAAGLAFAGIVAICCSVIYFDASMAFPGWVALLPVLGTVAVLVAGALYEKNWVSRVLSTPPMVMIGKLSYSWYLWHWPLLVFVKINSFGDSDLFLNLITVFVALILALLTYHFVENPIRHNKPWAFATQKGSLKSGAGLVIVAIVATSMLLGLRNINMQATTLSKQVNDAYLDFSPSRFACSRDGNKPLEVLNKAACEMGDKSKAETIVVWGDSHSDHWMPLIIDYFKNHRIIQYSMPGCPPLVGNKHPDVIYCQSFSDLVASSLKQNPNLEGVILAARWPAYIGASAIQNKQKNNPPSYLDVSVTSTQEALNILEISLDRTLTSIGKSGLKILVMAPTPEFKYPVPVCIFRKSPDYCQSSRAENDAYREKVLNVLTAVVAKHPNAKLANSYDAMCNAQQCPVINDQQQILYGDGDHLTGTGAKKALTSMQNEFAWFAQSQTK